MLHDFEDADLTEWRDCGGSSWYIDPSTGHESKFSLRSGPIDCTGISRICREVKGPAEVTFWWQCEPLRQGIAELTFTADDTRRVCDSSEWSPISYTVRDNNTHQLIWEFRKIKCYPKNAGAGWIDDVCISSETPTIPSEIKMGNISDGNTSCDARVISSGVVVELSNFTIVANAVTMETTNVTINPSGDVLINPNEVNISPDKVSMNTSEILMSTTEVVMGNVTMNASGDVLINPHEVAISSNEVTMDNSDVAISAGEVVMEAKGATSVILNTSANTSATPVIQSINVTVDSILSPVKMIPLQEDVPPSVMLISPKDSSKFFVGSQIDFRFKSIDDGELEKCTLYINGSEVSNSTIFNGSDEDYVLTHKFGECGSYKYYIICEDKSRQSNCSEKWSVSIQPDTVYVNKNKTEDLGANSRRYYSSIRAAIDDVLENTTIIVEPDIYEEDIIINKPLKLRGNYTEPDGNKPIIYGKATIISSNVEFEGFNLSYTNNCIGGRSISINNGSTRLSCINISNNNISGFTIFGIQAINCDKINIDSNIIDDIRDAGNPTNIYLQECNEVNITENKINKFRSSTHMRETYGIKLKRSSDVSIRDNEIHKVKYGLYMEDSYIKNIGACKDKNESGDNWFCDLIADKCWPR